MLKCTLRVNIVKRCFVSGKNSKPKFVILLVQILSLGLMMEKFNNTLLAVYLWSKVVLYCQSTRLCGRISISCPFPIVVLHRVAVGPSELLLLVDS